AAAKANGDPNALFTKVGAFYKSFMDEKRIDALGTAPLRNQLAWVKAAKTREDLESLMGRGTVDFDPALFAVSIDVDIKDPDHYTIYLSQSGLGLPDRDFYLEPGFAKTRDAYQDYAAKLLKLIGWPNPDAEAKNILAFETKIAKDSWSAVQQRDLN